MSTATATANPTPTMAEMMAMIKGLQDQNKALQATIVNGKPAKAKRIVKRNTSGGIYITDSNMKGYSEKKGKEYQAGINIQAYQLEAWATVLSDPSLIKDVLEVMANPDREIRR